MNRAQRTLLIIGGFALALTLFFSAAVSAGQLQDRMKARLPEIVALKPILWKRKMPIAKRFTPPLGKKPGRVLGRSVPGPP